MMLHRSALRKRFARAAALSTCALVAVFAAPVATASAATINVPADQPTIAAAVGAASSGDTIQVAAGNYTENVTIGTSNVTLQGAGAGTTKIIAPINGTGSAVAIAAAGVKVDGFTITRNGNDTTNWNGNLASAGISISGGGTGAEVSHDVLTGNRTGIDINNVSGSSVHDNDITDNRTGMIFGNATNANNVRNNNITNNWTGGIVFLDRSGNGTPPQSATGSTFTLNNISGNWYGGVVDRQSGGTIPVPGTNLKDFAGNWWGVASPVVTTANTTEPGYAGQIPTEFGGTATPPGGQPDIAGPASANFDYSTLLPSGTDTSNAVGFQPALSALSVITAGAAAGTVGRIQTAVNLAAAGATVTVAAGTFTEQVEINKNLTLVGAGAGSTTIQSPVSLPLFFTTSADNHPVVYVHGANVDVSGLTVDGLGRGSGNYRMNGIAFNNAAGSIHGVTVTHIRENPLNGTQQGTGIFVTDGDATARSVTITNNTVTDYQKNGITVSGAGLTATIDHNTVTGAGPTALIAQNGIQSSGTTHSNIHDNTVSGNDYTPASVVSTGILDFASSGASDTIDNNVLTGDQAAVFVIGGTATELSGNAITGALYGISTSDAGVLTLVGNTLQGDRSAGALGIDAETDASSTGTQSLTATSNTVRNWDVGVNVFGPAGHGLAGTLHSNRIVGSVTDGVDNDTNPSAVNATGNWWGCNAGPGHNGCDSVASDNSGGAVDSSSPLQLTLVPSASSVAPGKTATLTASLGAASFPATSIAFGVLAGGGSLGSASATTASGDAASVFTAPASDDVTAVTATLDNQTVGKVIQTVTPATSGGTTTGGGTTNTGNSSNTENSSNPPANTIKIARPNTTIDGFGIVRRTMRARFHGTGGQGKLRLQCRLDKAKHYRACKSPDALKLKHGKHTLRVRAVDSRGLADLSPAKLTFTI